MKLNTRNSGIDLLRIVSMFMVVILHILGQGGVLGNTVIGGNQYRLAWLLEISSYCAVNCYALISGYIGIQTEFRYYRIIVLWLQVFFYTMLITLIFSSWYQIPITEPMWNNALFPVISQQYWYFTAYIGMFFFIPLLNKLVNELDDKTLRFMAFNIIIVFSFVKILTQNDLFGTKGGYSTMWLSLLYILGGTFKRLETNNKLNKSQFIFIYFVCIIFTWVFKLATEQNPVSYSNMFISYDSPTILIAGISLFLCFSKIKISNQTVIQIISFFGPLSFSVYLIHANYLIWNNVMLNYFRSYSSLPENIFIYNIVLSAILIYIFCSFIDAIRLCIFKKIKINYFLNIIENNIKNYIKKKETL